MGKPKDDNGKAIEELQNDNAWLSRKVGKLDRKISHIGKILLAAYLIAAFSFSFWFSYNTLPDSNDTNAEGNAVSTKEDVNAFIAKTPSFLCFLMLAGLIGIVICLPLICYEISTGENCW